MRRRDGDRRTRPRFEIVGDLWGTVETTLQLPLRNVGLRGALVESHVPLTMNSIHRVSWDGSGREVSADVRVCHVTRSQGADGEHTFLVGLEFVAPTPVLIEQLQRWFFEIASQPEVGG